MLRKLGDFAVLGLFTTIYGFAVLLLRLRNEHS